MDKTPNISVSLSCAAILWIITILQPEILTNVGSVYNHKPDQSELKISN